MFTFPRIKDELRANWRWRAHRASDDDSHVIAIYVRLELSERRLINCTRHGFPLFLIRNNGRVSRHAGVHLASSIAIMDEFYDTVSRVTEHSVNRFRFDSPF